MTALGSTDAECDEVFKIWRGTFVEDIVHGCSYFENDTEFYWEPVKLFEGRGDDTDIANRIMVSRQT